MSNKDESKDNSLPFIAGIGASAGGLNVLKEFVATIPKDSDMAFIIVQHLDPNHESLLPEILDKETELPVQVPEDREKIKADVIYVIPPNKFLEVKEGHIRLVSLKKVHGMSLGIDHLFRTIARECGHRCAGIVLSGAGNDGTAGLRAIRAAGGLTMVQDPMSAEHSSMPDNAVISGVVDRISGVGELMAELKNYTEHHYVKQEDDTLPDAIDPEGLQDLAVVLELHEGFDIRQYKENTVMRRLVRRMGLTSSGNLSSYLEMIRKDKAERKMLVQDLLINVTDFFRDREAFSELRNEAVNPILKDLAEDDVIRIWVAGCSTGEEAYSIAILLLEAMEKKQLSNEIRIFATDLDQEAIHSARRGLYPESIASEVEESLLGKYFVKLDNGFYKVKNKIRDLISFAVHNVVTDPPFSNMHLISCRNLLIYLQREVQRQIIRSMEFSVKTGGYLFLGSAESIRKENDQWDPVSSKYRLYRKKTGTVSPLPGQYGKQRSFTQFAQLKTTQSEPSPAENIRNVLLRELVDPTIVVDSKEQIVYNHGKLDQFVKIPQGEPNYQLYQVVHTEIRSKVRSAVFKVGKNNEPVIFHHTFKDYPEKVYEIQIRKLGNHENALVSISFHEDNETSPSPEISVQDENKTIENLELELAEARMELTNTIAELESNSEELKTAHEEAVSTNEELQSANEELEASSEELRSLNEELRTVNDQLKEKIGELQDANDDVRNFFSSTNIPTIFLDTDFKIQRYTPAAEHLLGISRSDSNRPVFSIHNELVDGSMIDEARKVLQHLNPVSSEKHLDDGRYFVRNITPYRTEDRKIDGVVISFHDITESRKLSKRAESREHQQAVIARIGMRALGGMELKELFDELVKDIARTLEVEYVKILRYQPEEGNFLMVSGTGWKDGIIGTATVPDNSNSQAGFTLRSKDPVIVGDLSAETRFVGPALLTDHQVVSGISCVINHSEPPFGVLGAHTSRSRNFTQDDANFLRSAANLLSIAIREQQVHQQMLANEAKFRTLANTIPQLAWMTDKTGYIVWYNDRWFDYTGSNMSEMEGWGWQKVHHPDHVDRVTNKFKDHIERGEDWEDTFPLRGKDGEYRWFLSRACVVRNENGEIINWFGTNTDITVQLETEKALSESEEKLRIAKDSGRLGAFEYYYQENKVVLDPFLSDLWGYSGKSLFSHEEFWSHIPEDERDSLKHLFNQVSLLDHGGHMETEFRLMPEGEEEIRFVESSGQVIFEEDIPTKMIGMIIDITERKKLENQLNEAIAELQVSNQKKNQFLATLGHELRNPLASISGGLELLMLEHSDSDQLRIISNGVDQMSLLLDDLLDLTRIERGKIRLDKQVLNFSKLFARIAGSYESIMEDKGIDYDIQLPDQDYFILADPTRIEQIFNNLLNNACKFTHKGGQVEVRMTTEENNAVITIRDSGVGISAGLEEKIFQPFEQIEPDVANPGLGIGLSLVRQFVELHEGDIRVESMGKAKGSTFFIRLPLTDQRRQEQPDNEGVEAKDETADQKPLTIMIVDDNLDTAHLLSEILKRKNFRTVAANSGMEALEKVADSNPDVFILDIGLPDINGYELLSKIKEKYNGEALYIAHTGYGHDQARKESASSGFDYHLNKPLKIRDLLNILRKN